MDINSLPTVREIFVAVDQPKYESCDLSSVLSVLELERDLLSSMVEIDRDGVHYYLLRFHDPIKAEQVLSIKQRLLNKEITFDVLFSESFPCLDPSKGLAGALVMDMDMTTVQIEGIDEIARRIGVFDEVAAITAEAMHGKLDFSESLRRRVSKLKEGDSLTILPEIARTMPLTGGVEALAQYCKQYKRYGSFKTCIASGGFHELIDTLKAKLDLDVIRANVLGIDGDGKFTGELGGPIIDSTAKAELVRELKQEIPQSQITVIGDGANDLKMLHEAGLGIAYHAKPLVQEQCLNTLNYHDLSAVAALFELAAS